MPALVVAGANIQHACEMTHAALVVAGKSVGTIDAQIVVRCKLPAATELFSMFDCVRPDVVRSISGADLKDRASFSSVDESQRDGTGGSIHVAIDYELVWQSPRGAHALLLPGQADQYLTRCRNKRIHIATGQLIHGREEGVSGRQVNTALVRICEVERGCQITGHRPAPRRDVVLDDAKALLDELDHRGVIEDLGVDIAALAPGWGRL